MATINSDDLGVHRDRGGRKKQEIKEKDDYQDYNNTTNKQNFLLPPRKEPVVLNLILEIDEMPDKTFSDTGKRKIAPGGINPCIEGFLPPGFLQVKGTLFIEQGIIGICNK